MLVRSAPVNRQGQGHEEQEVIREISVRNVRLPLVGGFFVLTVLFVIIGALALVEVRSLGSLVSTIYLHPLQVSNSSLRAATRTYKIESFMKDLASAETEAEIVAALEARMGEEQRALADLDIIEKFILGEEGLLLAREGRVLLLELRPLSDETAALARKGEARAAMQVVNTRGSESIHRLEEKLLEMTTYALVKAEGFRKRAETVQRQAVRIMVVTVALGIVASGVVALFTLNHTVSLFRQRDQAIADLERNRQTLLRAQEIGRLGFWQWNLAEGTVSLSEGARRIFSPKAALPEMAFSAFLGCFHRDDREKVKQLLERALESEDGRVVFQHRLSGNKGGERMVEHHGDLSRDGSGKVILMTAAVQDITERRELEKAREELIADLEGQNAELERFTYTVSHDLKSPLITIRGFLGRLEKHLEAGSSDLARRDAERIKDAAMKMHHLLKDLLDLSRIGRLVNPPELVSLGEIVEDALKLVGGRIAAGRIEVRVQKDLPEVFVDRLRLVEVFQNLIDNAAKYMGAQASPMIEVGVRDGGRRVFFVRDNGVGIDPLYQEKIFGLFEKLDVDAEGTGIGLALVKRIVEVHGGRIWVESEGQGKGSTFCFTLRDSDADFPGKDAS